jgi:hypothetical protein
MFQRVIVIQGVFEVEGFLVTRDTIHFSLNLLSKMFVLTEIND